MRITRATPVWCPGAERTDRTALAELALVLGLSSPAHLALSRGAAAPAGAIHLVHTGAPGADSFSLVEQGEDLVLAGSTPRGLLHAVYRLGELLRPGLQLPSGIRVEEQFHLQRRIFHPRFDRWPGERADVRYLSLLGATDCLVDHDWQGTLRNLQGYVSSPIFPDAVDAAVVARQHDGLRSLLEDCADYGLGAALWLTELPCQGGPWVPEDTRRAFLDRFPGEVLSESGTYEGRVLCFGHPRVQAFYRDLVERFFTDFPEIGTLFLFGRDSGGELCDPGLCPRCRGMSLWDQRDRLLKFLVEEGGRVRPGLEVLTTGWKWDHEPGVFLERQRRLPRRCGVYLAAEKDGWQPERQSHDFLRDVRQVCAQRGQPFIGYDNLHWGDDTVHGLGDIQDYPLGVGAKIRRWVDLGADGVFDHWGTWSEDISSNSVACRTFFLRPRDEAAVVCRSIADRQFGPEAGSRVLVAWSSLERAHTALSSACTWSPGQWPGWYGGRAAPPLPETFAAQAAGMRAEAEAPKPDGALTYNGGTLADLLAGVSRAWEAATPYYRAAIAEMTEALGIADHRPVGYEDWWTGDRPVPTRREHIRRQLGYLESMAVIGREIGLHFGLFALYERTDRSEAVFRAAAPPALREDVQACLEAAAFVEGLGEACPDKIRAWAPAYREKARRIGVWLSGP